MELMGWSFDISAPTKLTQSFPSLYSGLGALEDGEGSLDNLHLSCLLSKDYSHVFSGASQAF